MAKRWFNWDSTKDKGLRKNVRKLPVNQINVETLSATKTLTINSKLNQHLNPDGAARNVVLPSTSHEAGDYFVIKNTAIYTSIYGLIIKDGANIIDTIYSNGVKIFIYNGSTWESNSQGSGGSQDYKKNSAFGTSARAANKGTAIGYSAAGDHENSFAKGNYFESERHGEHGRTINSNNLEQAIENIWAGETSDANWTEIFLDKSSAQLLILEDSAIAFDILIVAKTCVGVSPDVARYRLQGVINRVTTGNPAIPWQSVTADYESDATWDVRAAVDTTTDALIVEVKGAIAKLIYWNAILQPSPEIRCP